MKSTVEKRIEKIQKMAREERSFPLKVDENMPSEEIIDAVIKWTIERYVVNFK